METFFCKNCNKEHKKKHQNTNTYCNIACQIEYQYKAYIAEWKLGLKDGRRGKLQTSKYIYRYVLNKQDNKCAICEIEDWHSKPITLELDHIDGNGTNNKEDNLRAICPNCHSQTATYKAKNKGNGRSGRK